MSIFQEQELDRLGLGLKLANWDRFASKKYSVNGDANDLAWYSLSIRLSFTYFLCYSTVVVYLKIVSIDPDRVRHGHCPGPPLPLPAKPILYGRSPTLGIGGT